ncbi:hypothetical protein GF406_15065 [candidate division KSB1 bacterium]|jgi:hypothetical protein|nr:hypothetical protein [candidate division KSB1 bacterium]
MGNASSTKYHDAKIANGSMETPVLLSLNSHYSLRLSGIRLVGKVSLVGMVGIPAILVLLLWILS